MKKLYPILLSALFLAASCSKGDLPKCEECYEGEVRCLINGQEWKAKCESGLFGCTPYQCRYYQTSDKAIEVIARDNHNKSTLFFGVTSKQGGIRVGLNSLFPWRHSYRVDDGCGEYATDTISPHELTILSIDTVNRIIEGEFNYTAVGECGKVVEITDGYFKVDYRLE